MQDANLIHPLNRNQYTALPNCCLPSADLAQRLRAAAAGEQYDEASESEDAEISDVSQAADKVEEDDVDIMNSPDSLNRPGISSPDHDPPKAWLRQVSQQALQLPPARRNTPDLFD